MTYRPHGRILRARRRATGSTGRNPGIKPSATELTRLEPLYIAGSHRVRRGVQVGGRAVADASLSPRVRARRRQEHSGGFRQQQNPLLRQIGAENRLVVARPSEAVPGRSAHLGGPRQHTAGGSHERRRGRGASGIVVPVVAGEAGAGTAWRRTRARPSVAKEVATLGPGCPTMRARHAKGPVVQGLPMRRRGLEPPPGYPGPGPQPGNPGVISVLCVQIVQPRARNGRTGRSGCCHGCCHEAPGGPGGRRFKSCLPDCDRPAERDQATAGREA